MEISILTDVGQKRTNNQDYVNHYVNRAGRTMIILADGMGGHRAGNIASEMAVTDLGIAWVDTQIDTINEVREWFANNLEMENNAALQCSHGRDTLPRYRPSLAGKSCQRS